MTGMVRAFVVVFALVAVACVSRATRIDVRAVEQLRVTSVTGPRASVELALSVKTNAPVDSTVTVIAYEIGIAGSGPIARGGKLAPIRVTAGGIIRIVLPAEIALDQLPADLPALAAAAGGVPYQAVVWIEANTVIGTTQHRLEPRGTAPLAETFTAIVDAAFSADAGKVVGVGPFGIDGAHLAIGVDVAFPGHLPFPITVTRVTYSVALAGNHVGRGESRERFVVAPRTGGRGKFHLRVPALTVSGAAAALLAGKRDVVIEGIVEIEPIGPVRQVPFRARTTAAL